MRKIAFLFAGQGAQTIGMGQDLAENFPCANAIFDEASEALGMDMKQLIWHGDAETLMITENTQPAILTMSVAALRILEEKGIRADVCAGLSLGEYSAHVASGSLHFLDAVSLVKKRGKYMQEEVPVGKGAMAAIIGLSNEAVDEVCQKAGAFGICEGANYNCPGQVAISGEKAAIEKACEIAKEMGAKRAVPLAVSGPFHSSMLKGAGEKLAKELSKVPVFDMNIPVITNVTADYVENTDAIKDILAKQVSCSVRWEDGIRRMIADGVDTFIEIGPGKALSGFMKRIDKTKTICNVADMASLEATLQVLEG